MVGGETVKDLEKHLEEFANLPMETGPVQTLGGDKPVADMDMAELWDWLRLHEDFVVPYHNVRDFWHSLDQCLVVDYQKVNPDTDCIDDDPAKNTKVDCWLEFGPLEPSEDENRIEPFLAHDINLDCGGDTFEEAFRNLCNLVLEHYGDYERCSYDD